MSPQELLTGWVRSKHGGQLKKYNGEPYFNHLASVAEMAKGAIRLGYEIGLCHDLLEDTRTTGSELKEALVTFGYFHHDADDIAACVAELTDQFTSAASPDLSRNERKEKEEFRLRTVSSAAQTVKYCDLIDNMTLVIEYERKHGPQYLQRKKSLLQDMNAGNIELRLRALAIIDHALIQYSR